MPTVANLPGADLDVTFPSGKTKRIFLLRVLVQTQNAECKATHGVFLPNVGKLRPTIKALREEYELDYFYDAPVRTWKECAAAMRHIYTTFSDHLKAIHDDGR